MWFTKKRKDNRQCLTLFLMSVCPTYIQFRILSRQVLIVESKISYHHYQSMTKAAISSRLICKRQSHIVEAHSFSPPYAPVPCYYSSFDPISDKSTS